MGFGDLEKAEEANQNPDRGEDGQESGGDPQGETAETPDPRTTPAFEFEETKNNALYAPESIAKPFNNTWKWDIQRHLGKECGIENVAKREWHAAVLLFATEHPEEVADLVTRMREKRYGPIEDDDDD